MLTSLYSAISGMNANGTTLSVIGDNIANLNSVGFKSSRISFGDALSQTLAGAAGSSQVGRGVFVSGINPLFTQGSFETTASGLDMAIDGEGFFIVNDSGARYYSRAGQFSLNKNGYITNMDGLILQGYLADPAGNITGATGDLQISGNQIPANMTANAEVAVNLNAASLVPAGVFTLDGNGDGVNDDPTNYNQSTTISVFDSQGQSHDITLYFVKAGVNAWTVNYVNRDPANPALLVSAGTQSLTFDNMGLLVDDNSGAAVNFNFGAAVASPQAIRFNYGTGTGEFPPGSGLDATTQFASDFAVMKLSQDGYASGFLKNLIISETGVMTGVFTNGQTRSIGQIALAKFISPTGLTKLGRNLYGESFDSGQPIVGSPATSGLGRVLSNTLELSNVDLAEEFVKMISAQRGFQANSRIISTTDDLLQELVNLKR